MQCYINSDMLLEEGGGSVTTDFSETGMCNTSGRTESVSNFMNHAQDCRT